MRIKYIGRCGNDLTTGAHYEAVETGASANLLTILADDAGEEHTVLKHDCHLLGDVDWDNDDSSIADVPAPCDALDAVVRVLGEDYCADFADEFVPDPRDPNHHDAAPTPEGPESTSDLRQYRFKPELY